MGFATCMATVLWGKININIQLSDSIDRYPYDMSYFQLEFY